MERADAERHLQRWMHHVGHAHIQGSYELLCSAITDLCAPDLAAAVTLHDDRAKRRLVLAGRESAVTWRIVNDQHVEARLWTPHPTGTDITVDCSSEAGGSQTLREVRKWTFHNTNDNTLVLQMVTNSLMSLAGATHRRAGDPDAHNAIWRMAKAAGWPVPPMTVPAAS